MMMMMKGGWGSKRERGKTGLSTASGGKANLIRLLTRLLKLSLGAERACCAPWNGLDHKCVGYEDKTLTVCREMAQEGGFKCPEKYLDSWLILGGSL